MRIPGSKLAPAITLLALLAAACGGRDATGVPARSMSSQEPLRIEIDPTSATLTPSETRQFTATVYTPSGEVVRGAQVTWSSTDNSVASVAQTGLVTAIGAGVVVIGASFGPSTGSAEAVVDDPLVLRNVIIYTTEEFGLPEVAIVRPDGSGRRRLTTDGRGYAAPVVSPDGRRIAVATWFEGIVGIGLMNSDGSGLTRLVARNFDGAPAWSPDGAQIAFRSMNDGPFDSYGRIYIINVDGTGLRQLTPDSPPDAYTTDEGPTWSPDGSKIAFSRFGVLHVINADGTGLTAFDTPELAGYPDWSPDGTRIAYQGDATQDIYVRNADGTNPVRLTTDPRQENMPRWSPDGQRLVFARVVDFAFQLFIIGADGTGEVKLSATAASEGWPHWSRVP